jgi:membrane dipeptidase
MHNKVVRKRSSSRNSAKIALKKRSEMIHKKAIIIDGLLVWGNLDETKYIEELRKGGLTAANLTVAISHNFKEAVLRVQHYKSIIKDSPILMRATTSNDIIQAKEERKVAIILGFQDGRPIEDKLSYLEVFYDLGVRIIQLTYNDQNLIGTGVCEPHCGGLTHFGRRVVKEMNRLGILIDLSHCCDRTALDAIEFSEDPVTFTHVGAYSLCNAHGRNKTDEMLKAVAATGGVIGITFFPPLVRRDPDTYEVLPSSVDHVLDHIDYVANLVGIDYVGFGSDLCAKWLDQGATPPESSIRLWRSLRPDVFGRGPTEQYDPFPKGLDRHTKLINLTQGLVARGYSEEQILKILGGNFLRLFQEVLG